MSETVEAPRINWPAAAPDGMKAMLALEDAVAAKVERKLLHLVKLRASQINGCAYCIAMHTKEALADGEQVLRLVLLDAWRESHLYDARERAALAWTEAVTRIAETQAPRDVYDALAAEFSEEEIAYLTLAIATINAWNRIAIAGRSRHSD
ncbi:MAG TPA: carboxymuconolactone decarboxylase family protein [Allosphingosinicella sp.]|jgi:AhpD family alkylhydroperoxidase|nr:carboxymuconolactone decarboxylase family protein [Allosphingosinicella sp.]